MTVLTSTGLHLRSKTTESYRSCVHFLKQPSISRRSVVVTDLVIFLRVAVAWNLSEEGRSVDLMVPLSCTVLNL